MQINDTVTGQVTTKQISVNLSGQGTPTTLASLAASITAAGGGVVTGTVTADNKLDIASSNSDVTFGFGEDNSGVLSSLGVNTFFTGNDATNIAVNNVLTTDPSMLAAGKGNVAGSNPSTRKRLSLAARWRQSQPLGRKASRTMFTATTSVVPGTRA